MEEHSINIKEVKKLMSKLSILYIEDEDNIRKNLTSTLEIIFDKVTAVSNVNDAFIKYDESKPSIILTDIQMEGMNGIDFVKKIRETDHSTPVILITAHIKTEFLLEATKLKLIDYLQKPVEFDTLFQALINATNDIIRQGGLFIEFSNNHKYNVANSRLYKNDEEIKLTSSEQKLLKVFIKNLERIVTYDEIKECVWDNPYEVSETAFKSLLNKLRNKIGKESVKNVSGVGYHLVTK